MLSEFDLPGVPLDARRPRASRSPRLRDRPGAHARADGVRADRAGAGRARGPPTALTDEDAVTGADIDAFNQAAEAYFTALTGWDHHLAKPFSQIEETPTLLIERRGPAAGAAADAGHDRARVRRRIRLAVAVSHADGLPRRAARRVADGAAHGARALRSPAGRRRPAGAGIPRLRRPPDRSARRERGPHRLLRRVSPRGESPRDDPRVRAECSWTAASPASRSPGRGTRRRRARSSSPIPTASSSATWTCTTSGARRESCGFRDLRMCVFHGPPHHVSLREYEELLAGGPAQDAWLASTRKFLRHVRSFCLVKGGAGRADSRTAAGLACDIRVTRVGEPAAADSRSSSTRSSRTRGTATWLASNAPRGGVALGTHLYDASGALVVVRLSRRAADRSAARDRARRNRQPPRHAPADPGRPLPSRARLRRRPRHLVRAGRLASRDSRSRSAPDEKI